MRESNLINGIVAKRNRSSRRGITMIDVSDKSRP